MAGSARTWMFRSGVFAIALLNVVIILIATQKYGAGVGWDGVVFIRNARMLLDGGELSIVVWPPGYPVVLAATAAILQLDPLAVIPLVNAACIGLTTVLCAMLIRRFASDSMPVILIGTAWTSTLSIQFLHTAIMAYSEPLFFVFLLLFFLVAERYRRDGRLASLLWMAVIAACATFARYAGVTLILTGALLVLWQHRHAIRLALRRGLLFSVCSAVPILLWLTRNYLLYGTATGARGASQYSIPDALGYAFVIVGRWFLPQRLVYAMADLMGIIVAVAAISALFFWWRRSHREGGTLSFGKILPLLAFTLTYTVFIVAVSVSVSGIPVVYRYLLPVFIPLTILMIATGARAIATVQSRMSRYLILGGLLFYALAWTGVKGAAVAEDISQRVRHGAGGYVVRSYMESDLLRDVRLHREDFTRPLLSNVPDMLYILAGIDARLFPARTFYDSETILMDHPEFEAFWHRTGEATVIWIPGEVRPRLYSPDDLREIAEVTTVQRLDLGTVYHVRVNRDAREYIPPDAFRYGKQE